MSSPISNYDHLSDMPDAILHHILSFLPTPESVRTSVLSSRWRHLWHCVPAFHFDVGYFSSTGEFYEPQVTASMAAERINQFIARRDSACPLLRFHLHLNCDCYHQADSVSDWISYARSHGVRDMSVHTFYMRNPPPLSIFFELPSVEALDLQLIDCSTPSIFPLLIAPSKLKALALNVPKASSLDHFLVALLCSSPDLQELTLYRAVSDEIVEITAPNLRRLTIIDNYCSRNDDSYEIKITCPRLEYLHLSSWLNLKRFQSKMPSLHEASMDLSFTKPEPNKQFTQIFMSLRSVTKLALRVKPGVMAWGNPWCLFTQMEQLPIFHKLKRLKFSADIKEDFNQQILLCFLMYSPNLSSLDVIHEEKGYSICNGERAMACKQQCQHQLRIPASLKALDHLKMVSLKGLSDEKKRREVLKMLSEHVNEWERVVVIT